jgi:hypothetical protein
MGFPDASRYGVREPKFMNTRRVFFLIGPFLALGAPALADYGAGPSTSYGVDVQEGYPTTFSPLPSSAIGSGAYSIATHQFDQVLAFNLSGTIAGLTLDGALTDLRHISAGGDESNPTYASLGMPASFGVNVAVIPAPSSLDATGLGTTILGSSNYVGTASVDDGIGAGSVGPDFSITLGAAAVAAANAAIAAGDPFYLVLSGSGYAGFDSSLEGDLSAVTLDVQTASLPSLNLTAVPEPSTLALSRISSGNLSFSAATGQSKGPVRSASKVLCSPPSHRSATAGEA